MIIYKTNNNKFKKYNKNKFKQFNKNKLKFIKNKMKCLMKLKKVIYYTLKIYLKMFLVNNI